jgi:hypothetical protein
MAHRLKVTLQWIQILDKLEPFYKERGEFRFTARVTGDALTQETRFPPEGFYEISDDPAWNRLNLDSVIYEGNVNTALTVELLGEELDKLTPNDQLDLYRREFRGDPASFVGTYIPGEDTTVIDPENMSNWRVAYTIERA